MTDRAMDDLTGSATIVVSDESLYTAFGYVPFSSRACPIRSLPFAAGGYQWRFLFYPTTVNGFFGVAAELLTGGAKARACFDISAVVEVESADVGAIHWGLIQTPPNNFDYSDAHMYHVHQPKTWLSNMALMFVHDHAVVFEMNLTVIPEEPPPAESLDRDSAAVAQQVDVPPSDMVQQLDKVFESKEGADVTFSVDGEHFPAHRVVLAMRSPVFRAAVYGEMKESHGGSSAPPITIDDMRPAVFDALLRYIYTDSLPPAVAATITTTDDDGHHHKHGTDADGDDMTCDLLVAADRYGVERLKLICERALCKRLDAGNVADILALADRQHCETLKDACIGFMATSGKMKEVAASQGYIQLRTFCPLLLLEVLEKSSKFSKAS